MHPTKQHTVPYVLLPPPPPPLSPPLQEDKEMPDLGVLKNVMAHNWVEPSKRERKRVLNYSEAEYYKQVGRGGWVWEGGGGSGGLHGSSGAAAATATRLPAPQLHTQHSLRVADSTP